MLHILVLCQPLSWCNFLLMYRRLSDFIHDIMISFLSLLIWHDSVNTTQHKTLLWLIVMNRVALRPGFFQVLGFFCQFSFHQLLHVRSLIPLSLMKECSVAFMNISQWCNIFYDSVSYFFSFPWQHRNIKLPLYLGR